MEMESVTEMETAWLCLNVCIYWMVTDDITLVVVK